MRFRSSRRTIRASRRTTRSANGKDTVKSQDGGTFVIQVDSLWGQTTAVAITAGLDARLIEAEAALQAGNAAGMMTILNALRAAPQPITASSPTATGTHPGWTTPVMAALTDPGTADARVNLLFREKAFWTFGRGQRLGDLRRLIRDYGRAADGSNAGGYPIGTHYKGGVFAGDLQSAGHDRRADRQSELHRLPRSEGVGWGHSIGLGLIEGVQERREAGFRLPSSFPNRTADPAHRGRRPREVSREKSPRMTMARLDRVARSEPIGTLTECGDRVVLLWYW